MDDQRFDRISRVIATSTSRRSALKGIAAALGGGALAAMLGVRPERAAAQGTVPPGGSCETGDECTTGLCSEGGFCYCVDPAEPQRGCPCDPETEGSCGDNTLVCCATEGGGVCTPDRLGCDPTGGECSAEPGDTCEVDADCCTGTCMGGFCACADPARPWIGCPCSTGTEAPCGGGTVLCCATGSEPGGPGICTSGSVGCNPTGECTSDPGESCESDADCCEGRCSDEGICYCSDPARPWIGCACNLGTEAPCGGGTEVCCPTTGSELPGGIGVCTSGSVGCVVDECTAFAGGACESDDDCCEGSCSEDGVCYCLDPAEPLRGCSCHTGTQNPCGDDTLLCCPLDDVPGADGICTPERLGCDTTGTCGEAKDSCKHHDDCCGYLHCIEGVCTKPHKPDDKPDHGGGAKGGGTETVTTLPSTGAGPTAGDASPWLGAAALAGAAAIAARKLRPAADPAAGQE
jgi:hypothetical protein